jgi:UDP-N-acetylmuramoyl-tripeptide--D-alanyl-D-alanine ligase
VPWSGCSADFPVAGISHDTRTLQPGQVYLALRGNAQDGHRFVSQALAKGASGLIVDHALPEFGTIPQLTVPDTLQALHALAAGVRREWTGTVIGLTGSVGKTTVKELIAAVLAQRGTVCKTPGNWNNEIGLPLSMLSADRHADFFVFELGMNHPGEIGPLAALLRPDWALLTEIGKAHIEFFDGIRGIAEEKASLLEFAQAALLDETSEWFDLLRSKCRGRIELFGREPFPFTAPLPGEHMVRNCRRAAALGRVLGLSAADIQAGFDRFVSAPMRWERSEHGGVVFINDAYNANPLSMRAALTTFAQLPCAGRRFAVLGAMRELGAAAEAEHRELGEFVDGLALDEVITIGEAGRGIICRGQSGLNPQVAAAILLERLRPGDTVLLKASRGERLEEVLELVKNKL